MFKDAKGKTKKEAMGIIMDSIGEKMGVDMKRWEEKLTKECEGGKKYEKVVKK